MFLKTNTVSYLNLGNLVDISKRYYFLPVIYAPLKNIICKSKIPFEFATITLPNSSAL